MSRYYTPLQAAQILGLSKNTMYKYLKDGLFRAVRLGGGRIRIPAGEIGKFAEIASDFREGERITERELEREETTEKKLNWGSIQLPPYTMSIYDWFLGLSAMLVAVTMFLFDYSLGMQLKIEDHWFWLMRIGLFGWGFGLVMTELLGRMTIQWKKIYLLLGAGIFSGVAAAHWYSGTYWGMSLYISMVLGILVCLWIEAWPRRKILIHILLASVAMLVLNSIGFENPSIWAQAALNPTKFNTLTVLILAVLFVSGSTMYLAQERAKAIYLTATHIVSLLSIVVVYIFVLSGMWDRAMLLLIMVVFAQILPYAEKCGWDGGRCRPVLIVWMGTLAIMITVVAIVGGLVGSMKNAYVDKTAEGVMHNVEAEISRTMELGVERMQDFASEPAFLSALETKQGAAAQRILGAKIRTSSMFVQSLLIDKTGQVITYYPETYPTLTGTNVAYRDYFQQAIQGHIYWGDELFRANIQGAPWITVIAVPITNAQSQVEGILIARLNFDLFEEIIAELPDMEQNSVYLLDKNARVIAAKSGSTESLIQELGEMAANISLAKGEGEIPEISSVTMASALPLERSPLTSLKTECCKWHVVVEPAKGGVAKKFEMTGLAIILGMMVTIAGTITVVNWAKKIPIDTNHSGKGEDAS